MRYGTRIHGTKLFWAGLIAVAVFVASAGPKSGWTQSSTTLLDQGIYAEETQGDLDAAIGIYEKIVENHDADHANSAIAQFRLGVCYMKKGMEEEAAAAFRKVVDRYADQPALVAQARVRLTNLGFGTNGETLAMSTRRVWVSPEGMTKKDNVVGGMDKPSPDGRYFSFVNWEKGDLAVYDNETGESWDLTDEGTWERPMQFSEVSVWSPDGRQVAYHWINEGEHSLRIVGLEGSKPRILSSVNIELGHAPFPLAWSRDGKNILAFSGKKDESLEGGQEVLIVLVSVADGSQRILKSLSDQSSKHLSLSPDGRYVAGDLEAKQGSKKRNIYLLATDGSREAGWLEIKHSADDWAPFWTPDGKGIVFASDRSGSNALWMLKVDEGRPKGAPRLL